jgi:hypothetical protein
MHTKTVASGTYVKSLTAKVTWIFELKKCMWTLILIYFSNLFSNNSFFFTSSACRRAFLGEAVLSFDSGDTHDPSFKKGNRTEVYVIGNKLIRYKILLVYVWDMQISRRKSRHILFITPNTICKFIVSDCKWLVTVAFCVAWLHSFHICETCIHSEFVSSFMYTHASGVNSLLRYMLHVQGIRYALTFFYRRPS